MRRCTFPIRESNASLCFDFKLLGNSRSITRSISSSGTSFGGTQTLQLPIILSLNPLFVQTSNSNSAVSLTTSLHQKIQKQPLNVRSPFSSHSVFKIDHPNRSTDDCSLLYTPHTTKTALSNLHLQRVCKFVSFASVCRK